MTRPRRHRLPDRVLEFRDRYVTVAGEIATVAVEHDPDPRKIDHIWITVHVGEFGRLRISLSTVSRQSRAAGLDSRVRLGIIASAWTELPRAGVRSAAPLDYASLEAARSLNYITYDRIGLEELIVAKAKLSIFVEARGEFYVRAHIGVHQVHSRRASQAVPRDVTGRDGTIQFYFREPKVRELLLFKFAGQL